MLKNLLGLHYADVIAVAFTLSVGAADHRVGAGGRALSDAREGSLTPISRSMGMLSRN
jgi:hypothetical protein